MNECDKIAAAKVIAKYFDSRTATEKECKEIVGADEEGKPLSRERAMGNEHDKLAQRCAEERLRLLKPGGFSIKPTYRRNPETGQVEYLPDSLVNNLLRDFKGGQLLGSIEPDVVVHVRNAPYSIQAVYDFKLPCVSGRTRRWSTYESGPHKGKSQGGVYKELLKVVPIIIGF